jgi:outer membrane receptor protein involved in Fe transport
MINRILITCILLIFIGTSYAQNGKVNGIVSSEGEKVAFANVYIKSISKRTLSDSLGYFAFNNIPEGAYQITIMRVGYLTQTKTIYLKRNEEVKLNINLLQNAINFKSITIQGNKTVKEKIISRIDLALRSVSSSQDLLRLVPGLFIAQHAGGGKAEQIFMRGFDIDHGTDFAIYVDGMPVNMTSHAHGQGYADLHFLIPETVKELEVIKGPHATKFGDLATAGSGEFRTINYLNKNVIKLEAGMFNTKRVLGMFNLLSDSQHLFTKKAENLFTAVEYRNTDSYFEQKQNFYRFNALVKYNGQLNQSNKISISISTFQSHWDASGQIPERKVQDGTITAFGSIDPTEGGKTGRSNFNFIHEKEWKNSSLKNQIFYNRYDFNLYSNFTFYLNDSINGDQIYQADHRNLFGYNSTYNQKRKLFGKNWARNCGVGLRYDNSSISLDKTIKQAFLSTIVNGKLNQMNAFLYEDETIQLTQKLTLNAGVRWDAYLFNFKYKPIDSASGNVLKAITSPKLNLNYAVNKYIQVFAKSGFGFHSNDARVVVLGNLDNILAKAFGNELGSIFKPSQSTIINLAFWTLDMQSELVYVGDEGIVEIAGRTSRLGMDLGIRQQLADYLFLDADLNMNSARLKDQPMGANRIPLAPRFTSTGGLTYNKSQKLSGSIRYRFMGDRAAIEDNSIIAKGYFLMDANFNVLIKKIDFGLSVENLLNASWKEAQFATESRLSNEREPINEIHYTPGTPFFVKLCVGYKF